ncbi:uncharacterized protein IWZ02DRAFT_443110 [Phyllosticta citriasiana]|uniref:uncharacterized protein n=1 Tax=Phyllosticta citriasiana TaxID=595635 RepID=UPI0030FDCD24
MCIKYNMESLRNTHISVYQVIKLVRWFSVVSFIMGSYRSRVRPLVGPSILLVLISLFACHVASENSNYFSFPLLAASIPTVHNGDTVNVTWKSNTAQASLNHWCNQILLEGIDGLSGDGHHVFTIKTSWTSPCHFQYVNSADVSDYVDSGALEVTNQKATPAVTWVPSAIGTACGLQTATSTLSAGQKVTATMTIYSVVTASASINQKHALSVRGAGIGIGIAVGAAGVGLMTAVVWMLMRRRQRQQQQQLIQLDEQASRRISKAPFMASS